MALTGGYLVVYSKDDVPVAAIYDEYLNHLRDLDPSSEAALEYMSHAEELGGLDDDLWEDVLVDLPPEEREQAVAYRLDDAVLDQSEYEDDDMAEDDDDEGYGYN